jgi:hypothetical protein
MDVDVGIVAIVLTGIAWTGLALRLFARRADTT